MSKKRTADPAWTPQEAYDAGHEDGYGKGFGEGEEEGYADAERDMAADANEDESDRGAFHIPDPGSGEMRALVELVAEELAQSLHGSTIRRLGHDERRTLEDAAFEAIEAIAECR